MRGHIIGAGVLLGLVTAVLTAPIAFAEDDVPFLAAPGELLQPGNELHIQGFCPDPAAGPLTSPALTDIEVLHEPSSGPPNLTASGIVAEGTELGSYPVTMDCLGETLQVVFTVRNAAEAGRPAPSLAIAGDGRPQPGDGIDVVVRCDGEVGPPASPVLDIGPLREVESPDSLPVHVAQATIRRDTEPGEHPLSSTCAGEDLGIGFTVYPADEQTAEVSLTLQPTTVRPGDQVTATAECEESDTATLTSRVLRTVELIRDPDGHQPWAVRGATTVDGDADPGTYEVRLQCGSLRATASLTVLSDGPQVTRTPVGAPETGVPDAQRPAGALLAGAALAGASGVAASGVALRRMLR